MSAVGVYQRLYEDRFQFVQRRPQRFVVPSAGKTRLDVFVAASLGRFPQSQRLLYFERAYRDAFDASDFRAEGATLGEVLAGAAPPMTPLRIGSAGLKVRRTGWSSGPSVFFMDGTSPHDLVDYWNLRAIGWRVVPVPKQLAEDFIGPCTEFVKANHIPYHNNPTLMHETTILVSRQVKSDEAKAFVDRVGRDAGGGFVTQEWYPRLWDEWARGKDHAQRCEVVAREDEIDGSMEDDRVIFRLLEPDGTEQSPWSNRPKWVNVLRFKETFGHSTAGVMPPGLPKLRRMLDAIENEAIAATSEGIVVAGRHAGWGYQWRLPDGFQVLQAWLKSGNFRAQLSGAGRVAGEVIRMLGGPLVPNRAFPPASAFGRSLAIGSRGF